MKRILAFASLVMFATYLFAVQAYRRPFQAVLENGTPVTVRLTGDEFLHYYVDDEGNELVRLADGRFSRVQSPWMAVERRAEGQRHRQIAYERRMRRAEAGRRAGTFTGSRRGLVILVSFTDVQIQEKHTREVFDDMFNKTGYSDYDHIGSVRDYFKAQSYGTFEIDFDVVGPYTLENEMKYYGENDRNGNDKHIGTMAAEAVKLADADVDYRNYDWDGDGEVDQVFIVYAGFGEASGYGLEDCIWPLEWWLSSSDYARKLRLDGVKIDQFACSCELHGTSGTHLGGIGTACHEFSHCLGLPDFYDTKNNTNFGLDSWSLMDCGCYNGTIDNEGYTYANIPAGYTSYERMFCGWLTPIKLDGGTDVKGMKALTDEPEAYIIYNDAYPNEYYLLENRQLTSWDQAGCGHGMLVLHVDYLSSAWENNTVNNDANHQRCTIIPADNSFKDKNGSVTKKELAGDPYPGTSKNTSLTDTSTPAATLYNEAGDGRMLMGKPIEEIKEADGLISFLFMGGDNGTLRTPLAEAASDVKEHSFVAHWTDVQNAEAYTLAVTSGDAEPVLYEGITALSYEVTGLDSTLVHTYRVKATAQERESAWSNAITVHLKGFGEWTDWEPFGDGTAIYSYSKKGIFNDYGDKTYPIFVRTSNANPNKKQFRLYGWGDDMTLDIDCDMTNGHCSIAQQYIGYTDTYYGCGKVYVADEVYYRTQVLNYTTTWDKYPSRFEASSGKFTLYVAYYDLVDLSSNWGEGVETITVNGDFKDYSIEVELRSLHEQEDGTAMQDVIIIPGSNVVSWRYTVIDKAITEFSDELQAYIDGVTNGTIPYTSGEGTKGVGVTVSSGSYTVLVIAYDEKNEPKAYDFKSFRFSSSKDWLVLGNARYTDDVLCSLFEGYDMVTYDVEVHENIHTPGLFRMKNPYGLNHPDNSPSEVLKGDYYIEIDATDPQRVSIPLQAMGVDWGYGECEMVSVPGEAYYGKYENSVITFTEPGSIILIMGEDYYSSNYSGGFRLDLSTCAIPSPLLQENTDKSIISSCFDLQGRPVTHPQTGALYIRNGKKVIAR